MILFWIAVKEVFLMYAYRFGVGIFMVFELWQMDMCRFLLLLWPIWEAVICFLQGISGLCILLVGSVC